MKGSGTIGSGGYGCVFLPELQCSNIPNNTNDNTKYVSKLMINEHADVEYNLVKKLESKLKVIPNYENYFLIKGIRKCKPSRLTKKDLHHFDKLCKPLIKKNITHKNINSNLDKITALSIPYGGITIDSYMIKYINNKEKMKILYSNLISLLINGIIPMNKNTMYHGDIKSSNILVYKGKSKLIDWGLAFTQQTNKVHKMVTNRPFQFNVPLSCILFNDHFISIVKYFLKSNPNPTKNELTIFTKDFINKWNDIRGYGSISILNEIYIKIIPSIMERFSIHSDVLDTNTYEITNTPEYAIKYNANIIEKYIKSGDIELEEYYSNVYLKNLDLWGFVSTFSLQLSVFYENIDNLQEKEINTMLSLVKMFIHILEQSYNPIDYNYLNNMCNNIKDNYMY